jgi:hypothetical protein
VVATCLLPHGCKLLWKKHGGSAMNLGNTENLRFTCMEIDGSVLFCSNQSEGDLRVISFILD